MSTNPAETSGNNQPEVVPTDTAKTAANPDGMHVTVDRRGALLGLTAYGMWGLFPLYWPLLKPAPALEILAARIVWSFVSLAIFTSMTRRWHAVRLVLANRRGMRLLVAAAILVSVNWGLYIWAVNAHHVVETALGYFINPLVSVAFGVVVLRERLSRGQWIGIAVAAAAVIALTFDYGRLPWIALTLAASFGAYGPAKKLAGVDAFTSLTIETAVMTLPACVLVGVCAASGDLTMFSEGTSHAALLALAGPVTAIPLLFFGAAARRVPLSMLGLMQYLAPTLQFLIGVTIAGEHMPASRWLGFAGVWVALVIFSIATARGRSGASRARSQV